MKHGAWEEMIESIDRNKSIECQFNWFYGKADKYFGGESPGPFGEVLQLPTWAALNPVEETTEKPCTCKPVPADAFPDEPLIRVLKSRGYTVIKIY